MEAPGSWYKSPFAWVIITHAVGDMSGSAVNARIVLYAAAET